MSEYKQVLAQMKEEHPEMFEQSKDLKNVNMTPDEQNPAYWDRSLKPNKNFVFSREEEFAQKLEDAIQQDFEMHEVKFGSLFLCLSVFFREKEDNLRKIPIPFFNSGFMNRESYLDINELLLYYD